MLAGALAMLALVGSPALALAQDGAQAAGTNDPANEGGSAQEAEEKVNMVIIYGDDECPAPTGKEIVVCARKAENERYRIPERLRFSDDPKNLAWAERVERLEMVGRFGTLSCTPVGPGGVTGCTQQLIEAAYADRRGGSEVRFSQLIEAARAERLSTLDAEAAAEQERVEQIEREYMERLAREQGAPLPGEQAEAPQEGADAESQAPGELAPPPQ